LVDPFVNIVDESVDLCAVGGPTHIGEGIGRWIDCDKFVVLLGASFLFGCLRYHVQELNRVAFRSVRLFVEMRVFGLLMGHPSELVRPAAARRCVLENGD
jgi:hypothetical protein